MDFGELKAKVLADVSACLAGVDGGRVSRLVELLAAKRKVFLLGTGRSGLVLRAAGIRLGHLGVEVHILGAPGCPPVGKDDLVLAGSGSGRTPVPLEQAAAAHSTGATIALITADPRSPMAELADVVIHIPACISPPESSPHTLRSLFEECMLLVCDCVCRMLQDRLGISTAEMRSRHSARE